MSGIVMNRKDDHDSTFPICRSPDSVAGPFEHQNNAPAWNSKRQWWLDLRQQSLGAESGEYVWIDGMM